MADAWHADATDATRAAAVSAAPLALGHYAAALTQSMVRSYAVFLEAHVRAHRHSPEPVKAWQWHLCAAAWLLDQTFAASLGTIVAEHFDGALGDLDLLVTARRMSFFSQASR